MCISDIAFAATLHVPADHPTIQSCIDAATSGQDECVVAPGTYNELINFLGKAITLRSSGGPTVTTIDGTGLNGSVVAILGGESPATVLDGFTITGGSGSSFYGINGGGLFVYESSPTIRNNIIRGNQLPECNKSNPECSDRFGGGMFLRESSAIITRNIIEKNVAWDGGGMWIEDSDPELSYNVIRSNFAKYESGGIGAKFSDGLVACNVIAGNRAQNFAGVSFAYSAPEIRNNIIVGNFASGRGGGIGLVASSPSVIALILVANYAQLDGGGMFLLDGNADIANSIIALNSSGIYVHSESTAFPTFRFCDFHNNGSYNYFNLISPLGIQGNLSEFPLFVRTPSDGSDGWGDDPLTPDVDEGANDDYGDLRLQPGSPCINAGDPDFVPQAGETDLDGHARVLCGRVDMGAYEFGIGDYDCNQVVDLVDVAAWEGCASDPNDSPSPRPSPLKGEGEVIGGHAFRGLAPPATHHRPFGAGPHPSTLPRGAGVGDCEAFDFNADGDIDLADFASLQNAFTGARCMSDTDCDDDAPCTIDICEQDNTCSHSSIYCCTADTDCPSPDQCVSVSCGLDHTCSYTFIPGCCVADIDCEDGLSCTADTCQANHTCAHAPIPGCIKHTFATFTDPVSGFATQDVRDVNNEIVKFDSVRKSIVYIASGAEYQVGSWPVSGNFLGFGGYFQVRFGTVLGEHRAYFTETGSATICDFLVTPTSFFIYSTNTPVPHT